MDNILGVLVRAFLREFDVQPARGGPSEFLRFAPSLLSAANHVEYADLCKNVCRCFGVSASLLLWFMSGPNV